MKSLNDKLDEIEKRADAATEDEIWRDISLNINYQVSNHGNVRSLLNSGNHKVKLGSSYRLLKLAKNRGYRTVSIKQKNGKYGHHLVHRLVAKAFLGDIPIGHHVAHLDGNPSNNHVSNLKICTALENNSHKKIHGTSGEGSSNSMAKLQEWQVEEILFLASKSIPQGKIARLFDVDHKFVSEIISRRNWKHVFCRTDLPKLLKALKLSVGALEDIKGWEGNDLPHETTSYHMSKSALTEINQIFETGEKS